MKFVALIQWNGSYEVLLLINCENLKSFHVVGDDMTDRSFTFSSLEANFHQNPGSSSRESKELIEVYWQKSEL